MQNKASNAPSLVVSGRGPVSLRVSHADKATVTLEIGVDYAEAEIPARFYDADYCEMVKARGGVSLIFGKLIPGTSQLRTKVEITFPEENFVRQLWKSSREFHETVSQLVRKQLPAPLENFEDEMEKVQSFRSNNVFMAVLSGEAVMDFYYISPGDIHFVRVQKRKIVTLDPVIRIVMSTQLMFEFLEKCRPLAESLGNTLRFES